MGNIVKTCITMIIVITMVRLVTKVIITVCRLSCKKIDGSYGRSGVPRGGVWGVQTPPRNPEDIGGVLDHMSKKSWRLNSLL